MRPIKNSWYGWLIYYIPVPIRKNVGGFKDKVISLFKTNTPKQTVYGRRKKVRKQKTKNKIRKPFILKQKKKEIKARIISYIQTLFETEEEEKERKELEKKKKLVID